MIAALDYTYRLALERDENRGRPDESWVFALPIGETVVVRDREVDLDEGYVQEVARETRRLQAAFSRQAPEGAEVYELPVWRDHRQSHDREGSIRDVKLADKAGRHGMWVKLRYSEDTAEDIQAGKVRHVSVGIVGEYEDQQGNTYGPVLRELSLTADPVLKSIGSIQDTLDVELSQTTITELSELEEEEMDELVEKLEEATEKFEETNERLDKIEERLDEEPDDVDDDEGDEEEPETQEPEEDGEGEEPTDKDGDEEEPDLAAALSKTADQLERVTDRLDKIEAADGRLRLSTSERGRQGDPERPEELNLSYSEAVDKVMEKKDCSRLEAAEIVEEQYH